MSIWGWILLPSIFWLGQRLGYVRAINADLTKHTETMQRLIHDAYVERDQSVRDTVKAIESSQYWHNKWLEECNRED